MAVKIWYEAKQIVHTSNLAAAMSIKGMRGMYSSLSKEILKAHKHEGTLFCGQEIVSWLEHSAEKSSPVHDRIQDPYSLRCAPQVHGAIWEEVQTSEDVLLKEINASTDNPLVFSDENVLLYGGNFHAIYPARVSDRLASALTTLASISERRINLAMDNKRAGCHIF